MVQGVQSQNNNYFNPEQYRQVRQFAVNTEKNVESLDEKVGFASLGSLPMFRRLSSVPEKFKNDDYLPAIGLAGLAAIALPEDWRDVKSAYRQVRSKVDKNYKYDPIYNRKTHQHSFSFLRGASIEKFVHTKMWQDSKLAKWIVENDKTIYKSKFGDWVCKKLNIQIDEAVETTIKNYGEKYAKATKFKGSNFAKLTGRAMKRLPKLSILGLALIELPRIFKSASESQGVSETVDNTAKQTVKSAINVSSIIAGVGYGGALGQKYGGMAGSLVGMGFGVFLGSEASEKIQGFIA